MIYAASAMAILNDVALIFPMTTSTGTLNNAYAFDKIGIAYKSFPNGLKSEPVFLVFLYGSILIIAFLISSPVLDDRHRDVCAIAAMP